jgi:hypothetical protein
MGIFFNKTIVNFLIQYLMGILLEYNCTLEILRNITVYFRNIEGFKTLYIGNTDDIWCRILELLWDNCPCIFGILGDIRILFCIVYTYVGNIDDIRLED